MDTSKYTTLNVEVILQNHLMSEEKRNMLAKMFQDEIIKFVVKSALFGHGAMSVSIS